MRNYLPAENRVEENNPLSSVETKRRVTKPEKTTIRSNSITEKGQSSEEVNSTPTQDCKICMEPKYPTENFVVRGCCHIFRLDCTRSHVAARLEENVTTIRCPELNCEEAIEIEFCSLLLAPEVMEMWGRLLCESEILGPTKFYCPFKDCSAPLLVDDGEAITESECPHCNRLFCASCEVPWHPEIGCEEFQKLRVDEREREDVMLVKLAEKKEWQRCPNCRYYVERIDGCRFMKCRCKHCFCYNCSGSMDVKWRYCSKCNKS